jgi:hypothetical protein
MDDSPKGPRQPGYRTWPVLSWFEVAFCWRLTMKIIQLLLPRDSAYKVPDEAEKVFG